MDKAYYEAHKGEIKEKSKDYYENHKETLKETRKVYYGKHKEEIKETRKAYYEEHKEEIKDFQKAYRDAHKEERNLRSREWQLKRKYGLSASDYIFLFEKQRGCCKGCGKKGKLVVDHNHITGKIRGLLCRHCNLVLGFVGDSPRILAQLRRYLLNEKD